MARALKSLTLFSREAEAPPAERHDQAEQPRSKNLWISIYLPSLALEALGDFARVAPVVVTEPGREHLRVAAANAAALAYGVRPGINLNAAVALAASLKIVARSPSAERACLESLAAWAHGITSLVALEPPDSLSLEVGGSLALFGGLSSIKERIARELGERGWSHRICAAPTPLAALWLARHGAAADAPELAQLPNRLGDLPLAVTAWPQNVQALLQDMGVRTVGDCLRLPRDGFARRVGREYLDDLDRARGKRFDPRRGFVAPKRFSCCAELLEESTDVALLLEVVSEMLDRLVAELRREQIQARNFSLVLAHRQAEPTVERFELVEPACSKERFASLIADRLTRIKLGAPAIAVTFTTGVLEPLLARAPDLFAGPAREPASVLLERLRERCGVDAVYGVTPAADHRPERAWTRVLDAGSKKHASYATPCARPLWILPVPLPLDASEARALQTGSLQLMSDAERIESGWWDEHDLRRDYYTAVAPTGQRLWIYRDLDNGVWHLHGIFG